MVIDNIRLKVKSVASKNLSQKERSKLQASCGAICAKCHDPIVQDGVFIGEAAHIYGENPGSARYKESLSPKFVNSCDNLLMLCPKCHSVIDKNPEAYPVERLFKMKSDHQKWVDRQIAAASPNFTYAEIEVLVKYIIAESPIPHTFDYTITKLEDKIKKNMLESHQNEMKFGLSSLPLIRKYLESNTNLSLSKTLTAAVVAKYLSLKKTEETTVDIFNELWAFTSGNHSEISYRTAGLGILMYFFESCEVFEK